MTKLQMKIRELEHRRDEVVKAMGEQPTSEQADVAKYNSLRRDLREIDRDLDLLRPLVD